MTFKEILQEKPKHYKLHLKKGVISISICKVKKNYKLFYMYVSMIYLGGANVLTNYTMTKITVSIGWLLAFLSTILLYILYGKKTKLNIKNIANIIVVLLVWQIAQWIKWKNIEFIYSYFYCLIMGVIVCASYKKSIFVYYEYCTTKLSLVGVVLWILCYIIPFMPDLLCALTPPDFMEGKLEESNIFIFGLHTPFEGQVVPFFRRNCGFAWEPGRYSCFLVIALLINVMRTKFKLKNNFNFWILFVALLSTQSTTGFASSFVIVLCYLYNIGKKYLLIAVPICSVAILIILSLPFMGDKMKELWISEEHNEEMFKQLNYYTVSQDNAYVPQRFDGLLYEMINVINDPLLGYGKDQMNSIVGQTFNGNLILYNGLIKIFAIFGVFVGILYYRCLYKGSKLISRLFHIKGDIWFLLAFATINISYYFIFEPVFLAMFFIPFFIKKNPHRLKRVRCPSKINTMQRCQKI